MKTKEDFRKISEYMDYVSYGIRKCMDKLNNDFDQGNYDEENMKSLIRILSSRLNLYDEICVNPEFINNIMIESESMSDNFQEDSVFYNAVRNEIVHIASKYTDMKETDIADWHSFNDDMHIGCDDMDDLREDIENVFDISLSGHDVEWIFNISDSVDDVLKHINNRYEVALRRYRKFYPDTVITEIPLSGGKFTIDTADMFFFMNLSWNFTDLTGFTVMEYIGFENKAVLFSSKMLTDDIKNIKLYSSSSYGEIISFPHFVENDHDKSKTYHQEYIEHHNEFFRDGEKGYSDDELTPGEAGKFCQSGLLACECMTKDNDQDKKINVAVYRLGKTTKNNKEDLL